MTRRNALLFMLLSGLWFIAREPTVVDGAHQFACFDDAAISMRYAQHLAQGYGLVWNIGEPPVEGYTNAGMVALMAAVHLVLPPHLAALGVMLLGLGVLLALVWLAAESPSDLAPWLVASCAPVWWWTMRGTEVGLGALLVLVAAWLVEMEPLIGRGFALDFVNLLRISLRNPTVDPAEDARAEQAHRDDARDRRRRFWALCGIMAAGILVRDDLAVPLAVVALWSPYRWRLLAVLGASLALKTGFRVAYFGDPLPLTFYLKLTGVPLATRLERGFAVTWHELQVGWALPLLACAYARRWLPVAVLGSCIAYSVWVGGDAWEGLGIANRFLCIGLPLAMVGTAVALRERPWLAVAMVALTSGASWWQIATGTGEIGLDVKRDTERIVHGLALRDATTPDATIAVVAAGIIPYYAERRTVDLLGKADPVLAHQQSQPGEWLPGHSKRDLRHSLSLGVDVIDELYQPNQADAELLAEQGYVPLSWKLVVRRDSVPGKVDVQKVADLVKWDSDHGW